MASRPLTVLAVSEDRRLLRHLSQLLGVFGYQVRQAAGVQQAWSANELERPDFLIVDAELPGGQALELCRGLADRDPRGYVFKFLLQRSNRSPDPTEALQAGVDDFLANPVVHGELLVRLRAGARALENERRFRQLASRDSVAGCLQRGELYRAWARRSAGPSAAVGSSALVLVDVDFFERVNLSYGWADGDRVLRAVARRLEEQCREDWLLVRLQDNRFGIFLPGMDQRQAVEQAEPIRQAIAATPFEVGNSTVQLTASCGVADGQADGAELDQVLAEAAAALLGAKRSGRDCVVHFGQFDDEADAWTELAAPGKLFEQTRARDVMSPCTVVLRPSDPVARAAALVDSAQLLAIPVVDDKGKYVGVVSSAASRTAGGGRVQDVMTTDAPTFNETTDFTTLIEFCSRNVTTTMVILSDGRPTGMISPTQLASLTEPVTTATFAPTEAYAPTSGYLLVADQAKTEG